jgi:hypothetical protein
MIGKLHSCSQLVSTVKYIFVYSLTVTGENNLIFPGRSGNNPKTVPFEMGFTELVGVQVQRSITGRDNRSTHLKDN